MADQWDWYRAAIVAKNAGKPLPPVHDGKPEFGFFYAKASKAGGRIPVCIYADANGEIVSRWGTKAEHKFEDPGAKWTWLADSVTDRDSYTHAWTNGTWPDGTPTTAPALPAGSNLPTDPFERLLAEVDDKLTSATALLDDAGAKPDKPRADRARNLQAELLALNKSANTMHEVEKEPHLKAGRAVDTKFKFRANVEEVCKRLRTVFENIAKRLEAEANEAARREHAEQVRKAEDERQRIEAERAKLRRDDPIAALTSDEPELPPIPAAPEPVKVQVGGGVGRAAGLKTVWVPDVIDYEATLKHYAKHADIRAAVDKLVKAEARIHKESTTIPGVKMREDRRAA